MNKTVTNKQISAVMAALGRRNKGRPKAMTPAERLQRRAAGRASALARGYRTPAPAQPRAQSKEGGKSSRCRERNPEVAKIKRMCEPTW